MWFIVTDEATKSRVKIGPPPVAVVRSAALGALQALHGEPPRAATAPTQRHAPNDHVASI
jgi:hypothetical protein